MSIDKKLVMGKELIGVKRRRNQTHIYQKIEPELQEKRESDDWEVDSILKTRVKMKKLKPLDEQFEDEVWLLFASMGFECMNRDRHLDFPYSTNNDKLTKQIDVFAVDEETIIFVECKCANNGKKGNFKEDLEAIRGFREGLFNIAKKKFPDRKAKYIFATKNYEIPEADMARMLDFGIQHFDEYSIKYFSELTKHLGACARFQLLGLLFNGQKIGAMNNKFPAIEGQMGGYVYYSFSIEPEKLLKIAYVLHRNEANNELMPTYQRIIKKNRLKEIRAFINQGGFFPNSLIINIDTKGKKIQFDLATPQEYSSISRIGILHLPQLYRSAHIIDGQHRLYAYADSNYADNNSIPVVAFINLNKEKQVELFMEINENQKTVSKNLQNTLNADLLWTSDDWNKRRKALRLNLAQKLGETPSSPLYGRIIIGENEATTISCITIETIENALKSTCFLSRYSKGNIIIENGTFDKGDNRATRKILYPFLTACFDYFKNNLSEEWDKGDNDHGVLSINNTIHALIRVINDIVNHLINSNGIDPKNEDLQKITNEMEFYLAPLINYFDTISEDQCKEIKKQYGSGGKTRVWRTFQKVIADTRNDFAPEGLEQWIRDNSKQFNAESFSMIGNLEHYIKNDFSIKLRNKYGEKWIMAGLPPKVYKQANNIMGKKNYEFSVNNINQTVDIWDCVTLSNCKEIAIFGPNWKDMFEQSYTRPEEVRLLGGKAAKTEWLNRLAKIAANNSATTSIPEEDYLFLKSLHDWLIE